MVCNIYEKWCVPFSFLCYTKHNKKFLFHIAIDCNMEVAT